MKIFIVLGIVMVAALALMSIPDSVECAWCPSYPCYGSCTGDCVCVTRGGDSSGRCYSVQMLPEVMDDNVSIEVK